MYIYGSLKCILHVAAIYFTYCLNDISCTCVFSYDSLCHISLPNIDVLIPLPTIVLCCAINHCASRLLQSAVVLHSQSLPRGLPQSIYILHCHSTSALKEVRKLPQSFEQSQSSRLAVVLRATHRAISTTRGESDKGVTCSMCIQRSRGKLQGTPIRHMTFFKLALARLTSYHTAACLCIQHHDLL